MSQIEQQDKITNQDLDEWLASGVDTELIKLNVVSLQGNAPSEYLLYGLDRKERRNDGRLNDKWVRQYKHLFDGGWWCKTLNIATFKKSEWGCFKPRNPRKNYKQKLIKYEHPPKVATEAFVLRLPYHLELKIADKWRVDPPEQGRFWQWVISNPQLPLLITEGAKKAGCLLSCGYPAIALPGINNAYGADKESLIPELLAFAGKWREVCFVFDQDDR